MNRKPFVKIDNYRRGGKFRIDFTEETQLNKLEEEGLKFPERLVKLTHHGNQFHEKSRQNNQQQSTSKQTADTDINHVAGEFVELTSAESIQEAYNNIHSMEFLIPSPEKSAFTNNINISNEVCVQVNNSTITTSMDINNVLGKSTKHNSRNEIQIQNKTEQEEVRIEQPQLAFKCKQCDFHAANSESIISHHIESHMEYM
jgi:CRISPR/Cas system CSM-associated protein Csm5 (group 7 of RAMP superfamily)